VPEGGEPYEGYISINRSKPDRAEVTIRELNPPVMLDGDK